MCGIREFKKIGAAFRRGDLAALRAAVDDPASVPHGPMPVIVGSCLDYAIYHSPLAFIRTLLEIGADPPDFHPCWRHCLAFGRRLDHLDDPTCRRS
jgi:hypothetical protein